MELGESRLRRLSVKAFLLYSNDLFRRSNGISTPVLLVAKLCRDRSDLAETIRNRAKAFLERRDQFSRSDLDYAIRSALGIETAEWDLRPPGDSERVSSGERRETVPLSVYLERIRSPFNVGSIIRSAEAFGFRSVVLGPGCPEITHPRLRRSAMGADEMIEVMEGTLKDAEESVNGVAVAVETSGSDIARFPFPAAGVLVLGSEEEGLLPETLDYCRKRGGEVAIPLRGGKSSLNVGVAFGIAAAEWCRRLQTES